MLKKIVRKPAESLVCPMDIDLFARGARETGSPAAISTKQSGHCTSDLHRSTSVHDSLSMQECTEWSLMFPLWPLIYSNVCTLLSADYGWTYWLFKLESGFHNWEPRNPNIVFSHGLFFFLFFFFSFIFRQSSYCWNNFNFYISIYIRPGGVAILESTLILLSKISCDTAKWLLGPPQEAIVKFIAMHLCPLNICAAVLL